MAMYLGIDAGGTKTAFLLTDGQGKVLALHREGGCRLFHNTQDEFTVILRAGAQAVCDRARTSIEALTFSGFGISGFGESKGGEEDVLRRCEAVLGRGKVVCDCDCHIAWAGSLAMEPGINVISGTGANCYGVNAAGESARSNGWGSLFDEGSCQWIGVRLVQCYTKQADGRMPRTALYQRFRERFGIHDDLHFIERLNTGFFRSAPETAALQRFCKELYDLGDLCTARIYREAAHELAESIAAVAARLTLDKGYAASYSGGLFASGNAILMPLREEIAAVGGTLVAPRFSPEQGAVLMAMRAENPTVRFDALTFH